LLNTILQIPNSQIRLSILFNQFPIFACKNLYTLKVLKAWWAVVEGWVVSLAQGLNLRVGIIHYQDFQGNFATPELTLYGEIVFLQFLPINANINATDYK
jgi:hypothetical protein